jgi:hypothetical protein
MRPTPRPPREPLVPPGGIDHHVADMTATLAADVTLADAQARLAQHGQWLPIDGEPSAPLGALVESNSTGPLRLGYGAWRDLLLGCQFTSGTGELITAGGRTVKNVAGYDLTKFMVGQYGIYGAVVTITVRTYRRPEAALLATFDPDVRRLSALLTTPARPQWGVLTRDALRCGYLGDLRTIAFCETEVPRHGPRSLTRHAVEDDLALRLKLWQGRDFRASVPPASVARFVSDARPDDWSADAAFGVIVGSCAVSQRSALARAARDVGGSILVLDPSGKPTQLTPDPRVARLLDRLKTAFDPRGALEPIPVSAT